MVARGTWRRPSGLDSSGDASREINRFLSKGIQGVDDAKKCADLGFEEIVVSNHAGRQVDGAIGSLDALERIVESGVGERLVVTFYSGIRGAADVVKALALGAKFVFVGIWGLSIMGEEGFRHVMKGLLADLDILMNVAGVERIEDIDRGLLGSYPASYGLLNEKSKL